LIIIDRNKLFEIHIAVSLRRLLTILCLCVHVVAKLSSLVTDVFYTSKIVVESSNVVNIVSNFLLCL